MKKVNSVYDLLKIVLSIMIVLIHTKILPNILYPWLRIAVPLFFVMSSYFLFSKLNKENDTLKRKEIIKNFIWRNLKLYFMWFIILLPITLDIKNYYVNYNIIKGTIVLLRDFLFSSTFAASWYIIALVIGSIIIYWCSNKISNRLLLIITVIIYFLVTLTSTYEFSFLGDKLEYYYHLIIVASYNSFLVGLIWIMIGKLLAEKKIIYRSKLNMIIMIISIVLLFLEWTLVKNIVGLVDKDCYFMLIPLVITIFLLITNIKSIFFSQSLFLRKISTVMYVSHLSVIYVLTNYFVIDSRALILLITIIIGIVLTIIIDYLSRWLNFLKYAY